MQIAALAVGLAAAMAGAAPTTPPRPNILVILSDDMGWGQPGFNGGTEVATPNMDRLADEGVKLTQFYVQPRCAPTRASLVTGRYAWKTGMAQNPNGRKDDGLLLDERTIGEALRDSGYATWLVGKWHLGYWGADRLPLQRGFDHHYGFYNGFIDYFKHFRPWRYWHEIFDWHRNGRPLVESGYSTLLMADEASQLIERHNGSRPFFLYLAFNAAHDPFQAPQSYIRQYERLPYAEPDRKQRAMVKAMDDAIGQVMDALERRGVLDETLVMFLNDNGGISEAGGNGPYRGLKSSYFEGGIRVPAVMRWPDQIAAGSESDALLHVADLFPTLAGLAGADTGGGLPLDGFDAWEAIANGAESPREEVVYSKSVIRVGDWKLLERDGAFAIGSESSPEQLYNIAEDPYETTNLASSKRAKVAELRERLAYHQPFARGSQPGVAIPGLGSRLSPQADDRPVVYGKAENASFGAEVKRALAHRQAGNLGPSLLRLEAAEDRVRLVYDEPLDTGSVPPGSAFRVVTTPSYAAVGVTDVEASGSDVMLTLASRLAPGATVGITYDVPDSGAIRDADGLEAVGTTWQTGMASSVGPVWLSTVTVESWDEYRGYSSIASPDLGAVADHAFDYGEGAAYQVQVVMAYSDGVMFQVRNRGEAIAGLVLEWAGETLPLADAAWNASWDRYTWGQAWLDANAPSLNASAYAATLPDGSTGGVCLRFAEQTCPVASTAGGSGTASADATLSSLTLSGIDIGTFAAGTTSYSASVGNAVASTQVTATASAAGASVTIADGDGSTGGTSRRVALAEGSNTITVTVTAEDGVTTETYTVTVTREAASTDATLSSLTLSGIDIGTFAAGTTSYSASVGNAVASTQVTATASAAGASVTIADGDGSTDGTSRTVALAEGSNTITVTVTAEDGVTTETYTVTVTREAASTDATLSSLTLSGIDIGTFAAGTTSYSASVGNAVASTQVTATASAAGASVTIADGDGSTGGTSRTVALAEGSNTITVTVTAEDGVTTETYTVTVTREAASTDATLSSLTLSGIDIGTFAAGTTSYSASVGNAVASTQVTATASAAGASVTIADGDGSTDGASRTVALAEGANTITVTVTAADGVTTKTYTVTVTRDEPGLTARFESVPDEHDGWSAFDLRVGFSEELAKGAARKVESAISVSRATLGRVRRVGDTRDLFTIPLRPSDDGDVEVRLRASSGCSRLDSVCTADGQALSNTLSVTVNGPSAVSASANGPIVTLQWGSPRDGFGSPSGSDYGARVNGHARAVVSAALAGSTAWLTLDSAVAAGDTVTVAYLGSAMHPLAEATGQVRSGPWERLVAENLTGIGPLGAHAAIADWRPADPLAAAADDAVRLDASGLGLSGVWGIERLAALERLDLSGNAVADLSRLAGLANLRDLDLSGNRVTDLWPLAGLDNLERLNLSGTGVADVQALARLANLRDLDLSGNRVTDLWPLAGLDNLERLNLSGTGVTDVQALAWLANLRDLDLSGNRVTDLWPLAGLDNLERLNLSGTGVTDVQALAWLPNLKVLLLEGNDVSDAWPLAGLGQLENLDLGGNRIGDVTALRDLQRLRRLDLSGNPAADISPLGDVASLVWLALPGERAGAPAETLWRLTRLGWVSSGSCTASRANRRTPCN